MSPRSAPQPPLSPTLAQRILQRMGETGQPPERGALFVNVGTTDALDLLREEYLVPMREFGRNSSFKLVQAPFGGGKTHFLHCLREIAWVEGFATALVGVSPEECPFDDTLRIYKSIVQVLELPPGSPEERPERGIGAVLRRLLAERVAAAGEASVRAWIDEELRQAPIESHALRRAVVLFLHAGLDRDVDRQELLEAFLRGESVGARELAELSIRERLEDRTAFRFLRSVIQLLRELDVPGVVLMFDEMDRTLSFSPKRRREIGDNLRQMIDYCGQSILPSLLAVYAVPPEFQSIVVDEYPALAQRLHQAARFAPDNPMAPVIDLDHLPLPPEALFREIGNKLFELFRLARESKLDPALQRANLELLARYMAESALETGSRRTFVKRAVALLHAQEKDERPLARADVERFDRPVNGPSLEGEESIF